MKMRGEPFFSGPLLHVIIRFPMRHKGIVDVNEIYWTLYKNKGFGRLWENEVNWFLLLKRLKDECWLVPV